MFNVTVLKMKDIIRYFLGMIITVLIISFICKYIGNTKNNNQDSILKNVKENVKEGIQIISENNMLTCMDRTISAVENLNEEYRKVANEDEIIENHDILQSMLDTQISTMRGLESTEEKSNNQNEELANNNSLEEASDSEENNSQSNIELARNRFIHSNYNK